MRLTRSRGALQLLAEVRTIRNHAAQSCRVCRCTDWDCRGCIERTGEACSWVEPDLCSACVDETFDRYAGHASLTPAPGAEPEWHDVVRAK